MQYYTPNYKKYNYTKLLRSLMLYVLISIYSTSCISEFDLEADTNDIRLVVDAIITDEPYPQYIRLTESSNKLDNNKTTTIPIKGALVILTDDLGECDTLSSIDYNLNEFEYIQDIGMCKYAVNRKTNLLDTIIIHENTHFSYTANKGFYHTEWFRGKPGRTYTLRIEYANKVYTSTSYMHSLPKIGELNWEIRSAKDGEEQYIPIVYFKDVDKEINYYLFEIERMDYTRINGGSGTWPISVISDKYFNDNIYGMEISNGMSPESSTFYDFFYGSRYDIKMYSIDKNVFDHFEVLKEQFNSDGGVYKPFPSTPPSNISNNALGVFRVSSIKRFQGKVAFN